MQEQEADKVGSLPLEVLWRHSGGQREMEIDSDSRNVVAYHKKVRKREKVTETQSNIREMQK